MKVLLIAPDIFSKGGIQRYVRYQYSALVNICGGENVFLASSNSLKTDNYFEDDIHVNYVGTSGVIGKVKFLLNLIKIIRINKIDLMICAHVHISPLCYLINTFLKIPYFTNVYGLEIW